MKIDTQVSVSLPTLGHNSTITIKVEHPHNSYPGDRGMWAAMGRSGYNIQYDTFLLGYNISLSLKSLVLACKIIHYQNI